MKNESYVITAETIALVLKALDLNTTHACDGDEWNDEEVIAALAALNREIEVNNVFTG